MEPRILWAVAISCLYRYPLPCHPIYIKHLKHTPCLPVLYGLNPFFDRLDLVFFPIQHLLASLSQFPIKSHNALGYRLSGPVIKDCAVVETVIPLQHLDQLQLQERNLPL